MSVAVKIPKGWRKLLNGAIIRKGDRYSHDGFNWHNRVQMVGLEQEPYYATTIRRAQPRRHAGKGKK